MSVKAMTLVWEADLPRPEKFVLLAMADHADHEGGNISPSLGRIAWKTGYSYQKVVSIVKALRDTGVLDLTGLGMNNVNVYQIQFEHLSPLPRYENKHNPRGIETRPLEDDQAVKKVDPSGGKENRPLAAGVPKLDPLSGKESRPLEPQGVKKLDPGGKETLYKSLSFKLVNTMDLPTDKKIVINYLSDSLQKIGVTSSVSKRLLQQHSPETINEWLLLFSQAYDLGIARSAGWLVSALDQDWSLGDMQQRVAEECAKQKVLTQLALLPENILAQLPAIGWVGSMEELEKLYHHDSERFEHWLAFIRKDTPEDAFQAGRFLEGLRSGLPAPEIRSGRYDDYFANIHAEAPDSEPEMENPFSEYQERWEWCLESFSGRKALVDGRVVDAATTDDGLQLTILPEDRRSWINLQNVVGFETFSTLLQMIFKQSVTIQIQEFAHA